MSPLSEPGPVSVEEPVGEIVTSPPVTIDEKLTLREVAAVLAAADIGVAVVQHGDGTVSVVSERDVARSLADDADPDTVWSADVASDRLVTAEANEPILRVARRMADEDVRHLLVVERGRVAGIVSARDVFRVFVEEALDR